MTKLEYIEKMETVQSLKRLEKQGYEQQKEIIHRDHRRNVETETQRFRNALQMAQTQYAEKLEGYIAQEKELRLQWAEQEAEEKRREAEAASHV
ncbi:MAG: hypothetical protein IK032_02060 [Bacteroidales bacterium]|nr:hypothetical protein [Bacteroidales bacterium]